MSHRQAKRQRQQARRLKYNPEEVKLVPNEQQRPYYTGQLLLVGGKHVKEIKTYTFSVRRLAPGCGRWFYRILKRGARRV